MATGDADLPFVSFDIFVLKLACEHVAQGRHAACVRAHPGGRRESSVMSYSPDIPTLPYGEDDRESQPLRQSGGMKKHAARFNGQHCSSPGCRLSRPSRRAAKGKRIRGIHIQQSDQA